MKEWWLLVLEPERGFALYRIRASERDISDIAEQINDAPNAYAATVHRPNPVISLGQFQSDKPDYWFPSKEWLAAAPPGLFASIVDDDDDEANAG